MADITTEHRGGRFAQTVARMRVPLGFFFGAAVLWLSHPTLRSLAVGGVVAAAGELVRVWAAGHLEKGSEVTSSGPYRLMRHPLYAGSALIGVGVAVASAQWTVAALIALYLVPTIAAAVRHEEANMRATFGDGYNDYLSSRATPATRAFSFERVWRNKEYRAIVGLAVVAAAFAFKATQHL
jgi:protein-S-isoprenylcysteine O-methyltransferase Ste14